MQNVRSVSEVTQLLRQHIQSNSQFTQLSVAGEVSNLSRPSSGHLYFTLKDERARLRAVMFAGKARLLRFQIRDGMRVVVSGGLDLFERSGDYQIYVDAIQPDGVGALYLAYEQLRERLAQEGLFDAERKRPIPAYPARIALVTSATGAAVRDMVTTLRRRYPLGRVLIFPVAVQGEDAPRQIAEAITRVSQGLLADVMIVGRGGGSFEELYAFSTEVVARAAAASRVPVISAVGHETDVTMIDFVSDLRAATPTAAAELASPDLRDVSSWLAHSRAALLASCQRRLVQAASRLTELQQRRALADPMRFIAIRHEWTDRFERQLRSGLAERVRTMERRLSDLQIRLLSRNPSARVQLSRNRVEEFDGRLRRATLHDVRRRVEVLDHLADQLDLLSPMAVLRRGYAVVTAESGNRVLSSVSTLKPGASVRVGLSDGWLDCQVWGVHPKTEGELL
ncbi:MAG: exodeoxyribonuclease VII large subunit [Firmicutes bacterium]|nr:exodeoxyribonuclease VII large subunit [Bacillota bacterium]